MSSELIRLEPFRWLLSSSRWKVSSSGGFELVWRPNELKYHKINYVDEHAPYKLMSSSGEKCPKALLESKNMVCRLSSSGGDTLHELRCNAVCAHFGATG